MQDLRHTYRLSSDGGKGIGYNEGSVGGKGIGQAMAAAAFYYSSYGRGRGVASDGAGSSQVGGYGGGYGGRGKDSATDPTLVYVNVNVLTICPLQRILCVSI